MERRSLICSVNRALFGEVGPHLRAVAAKIEERTVKLRFFVDGEPSDDDKDSAAEAVTEVIVDFPDYELDDRVVRLDFPEAIPPVTARGLEFFKEENSLWRSKA